MRMKRNRLKDYRIRKRVTVKDSEGNTSESYLPHAARISCEVWEASGRTQTEMYGERLPYIRNIRVSAKYYTAVDEDGAAHYLVEASGGDSAAYATKSGSGYKTPDGKMLTLPKEAAAKGKLADIREMDGICLYRPDGEPDYKIISIRPERFLRMEAERI